LKREQSWHRGSAGSGVKEYVTVDPVKSYFQEYFKWFWTLSSHSPQNSSE
jgi:hypothetical protein